MSISAEKAHSKEVISDIASARHIAVVGVSDRDFGGAIYKTLKQRGYAVYPVHPTRETFQGDAVFASLRSLPPEVTTAIIAVSPKAAEGVVDDAVAAGFTHLWFQQGRDFAQVEEKARALGIETVTGKCILMYAQPVTGIHFVHRFVLKAFRRL